MKRSLLVLVCSVVLLSCDKNNDDMPVTCGCDKPLIGGLRLSGWDGTPDTADVYVYNASDSFTTVTGSMKNKPVTDEGLVHFMISTDSARDYRIVFRQSGIEHKLENLATGNDSTNCSGINNQFHCYSNLAYTLNGDAKSAPMEFDDYLTYDGYMIPVGY